MKRPYSIHRHIVCALAARSALRFTARRRSAGQFNGWRPMSLFWRQKRKGTQNVGATRQALTAGAVNLAQFHLHFVIRTGERALRHLMSGLHLVAASRQARVGMEHQRTITQSRMYLMHLHRTQSTIQVSSVRHAENHSSAKLQSIAQYPDSARPPIVPATTTWGSVRTQPQTLGQTRLRVHPGKGKDGKNQTFQSVQMYTMNPNLFRSHAAVTRHSVAPRSQENGAVQLYFQPQKLVWRRAMQPAVENSSNERQWDQNVLEEKSHRRSFTGKEAASVMPPSSGHVPATPVIKIDSALMDQMANDVIRRLERRARIERARQGL